MLKRFVLWQIHHKYLYASILAVILVAAAFTAVNLKIDPSFASLISDEGEFNTNADILSQTFEQNDALVILIRTDPTTQLENAINDLNSSVVDEYVATLTETLEQSEYVLGLSDLTLSKDNRRGQLTIRLQTPNVEDAVLIVQAEIEGLLQEIGTPPGVTATIAGLPVVLNRITSLLIIDNLITLGITVAFVIIILLWYSRNFSFAVATASVPVISLILLAAAMVLLDIKVTITLASVGVLVLGLGADYSIHLASHYRHARRVHQDHEHAMLTSVEELQIPIFASFLTTLAGFVALMLGLSPSSQAQGTVLALGITIIFFTTFFVFPVVASLLASRITSTQSETFEMLKKGLSSLAIFQSRHPYAVIGTVVVITAIMFAGLLQVSFSTSNSNWIPDNDPISLADREVEYAFGESNTLSLVLTAQQGDLRDVQKVRDIQRLTAAIEQIPNIDSVSSPFADLNLSQSEIYDVLTNERRGDFNTDYTLTTIDFRSQNLGTDEEGNTAALAEMRRILENIPVYHTDISIFGSAVRFDELGQSLQQDTGFTTLLGLILVFVVASSIYFSITVGVLSLIPIILGLIWAVGLMGFFNIPFTSLSTGIVSLVLGIGVDFSIHLVDGIKRFIKKYSLEKAIRLTMDSSGSAILLSSLTTAAGFIALTFATLLGTQRLGWSLAFSIVAVFVVTVLLVPAIMSLAYRYNILKR